MAVKPCKECGKEVSSKAQACPACGAPLKRKRIGCLAWIAIFVIAMAILVPVYMSSQPPAPPPPPLTAEQQRAKQIQEQFSPWDGSHYGLVSSVKRALADPDSYEHIETRFEDKGDHLLVIMKFRAKNAFGGYVIKFAEGTYSLEGTALQTPTIGE